MNQLNTNRLALLFPGVGAQYPGMGKEHYNHFEIVRDTFVEASDILKTDMAQWCFGNQAAQEQGEYHKAQLAVLTVSYAIFRLLEQDFELKPLFLAGHSLGEYTALCASRVLNFPDTLQLVKYRGELLETVARENKGDMYWIINLDHTEVEKTVNELRSENLKIFVSVIDAPMQCSISGDGPALQRAAKIFEEAGAIVFPLNIGGPYHSPLIEMASNKLTEFLSHIPFEDPLIPIITNYQAEPLFAAGDLRQALSFQLTAPVKWHQTILHLQGENISHVLEVGPKNILKFLLEKYDSKVRAWGTDSIADINWIRDQLADSSDHGLAFIAKCLKIAVSTRNENPDPMPFQDNVIDPFNRVQEMYERLSKEKDQPTTGQIQAAYEMTAQVLRTKKVPLQQQKQFLDSLKFSHLIKNV